VDVWGLLVRKDSPLAAKVAVTPEDIIGLPLLVSRQNQLEEFFVKWSGLTIDQLDITATYNLIFNAALLVEEGFGNVLCLDKLVNTTGTSSLCFIPLKPRVEVHLDFAWKKYQTLTKPAEVFWEKMRELCQRSGGVTLP